jgi:hypothetical protein
MSTNTFYPLPELPTELLIQAFAQLQVADLLSVQHTCRRFYDVISDGASLQYILHHETAWKNLELNTLIRFVASSGLRSHCYILQDGYLIYKAVIQYGYMDLYLISDQPNAAIRWKHVYLALGALTVTRSQTLHSPSIMTWLPPSGSVSPII